jgi:hypothetical protein
MGARAVEVLFLETLRHGKPHVLTQENLPFSGRFSVLSIRMSFVNARWLMAYSAATLCGASLRLLQRK